MNDHLIEILKKICGGKAPGDFVFVNPDTGTRYNRRPKFMAGLCKRAEITPIRIAQRKVKRMERGEKVTKKKDGPGALRLPCHSPLGGELSLQQ